jgi:mannosyl-oligosaccharide glucosidase
MMILYVAQEGAMGDLAPNTEDATEHGFENDVVFKGVAESLGSYKLVVTKGKGDHPESDHEMAATRQTDKTIVRSAVVPEDVLWKGQQVVFQQLSEAVNTLAEEYTAETAPPPYVGYLIANGPANGNVHVVQKMFEGEFEFDVIFSSGSAGKELTSEDVTREIKANSEAFNERFASVFNLQAPFHEDKYVEFAKSMFSNLYGGIGYFSGQHLVDRSYATEYEEENEGFWMETAEARGQRQEKLEGPYELFTSVPSRTFFPRGFLWDEGFHLIPIADWDIDVTLEVVKSWFNTMDEDGWIAREQILGPEPRSKVPSEFQVQYPHYANPPTLFFIIESFMNSLRKMNGSAPTEREALSTQGRGTGLEMAHLDNVELGEEYLRRMYPLLRRHYDWFRKTQRGDVRTYDREAFSSKEAYRWRGRSETHCLTSGLDDYPRASPPHPGELHVDLMSWVGFMARSLKNIADALGMAEDVEQYETQLHAIGKNLEMLHWSDKEGCFCDATIDEFEEHALVCHKGYISIFPFLVGLLKADDPKVGRLLDLIGDEEELFSPHGLRSLSRRDPNYGTNENYWRSPVWININYMALTQLRVSLALHLPLLGSRTGVSILTPRHQNLALQDGPYKPRARDLYARLRKNLVDTIYNSWLETGFAWEQYNPETGQGQRTQHFTGWTSLVVKIMAMEDLSGGGASATKGGHSRDEL